LDDASKRWLSTLFKSLSNIHTGNSGTVKPVFNPNISKNNNPFLGFDSSIYFNGDTKFMNMK